MKQTDLSRLSKQHAHAQVSLRKPLRCGFTIVLCSCLLFGAAQCRAQETQDAAEAARQERARKEQSKEQKHVYTEDDLGRAKILTPEDEARFAAQRHQQLAPSELETQDPLDASSELPQLPLADIARRYRDAKRAVQPSTPFHLPFDEPAFAAPVVSIPNVAPPRRNFSPVPPSLAPSHPHAVVAPSISNPEPLRRIDPFARRSAPAAPSSLTRVPAAPAAQPSVSRPAPVLSNPQPNLVPNTSSRIAPPKFAARKFAPLAGQPNLAPPVAPPAAPQPSAPPRTAIAPGIANTPSSRLTVTVLPGDSLWKLAQQNLGRGSRWHELLAANPSIVDPKRLAAGTEVIVPAQVTGLKSDVTVTVQQGDTLSKLARMTYGRAAAWSCIAQANPEIADVNRIYVGQQLLLPFSCQE
jgi:nucleoid-associated protein YgaU